MFFRQPDNSFSTTRPFKNSSLRLVEVLSWMDDKSLLPCHEYKPQKWSYAEAIDILQKVLFEGLPLPSFLFLQEAVPETNQRKPITALTGYRLLNLLYQVFYRRSPIDCIESETERPINFLALDLKHWQKNDQRFGPGSVVDIPFLPDTELEPTYSGKLIPDQASYLIKEGLFPLRALCHPGDLLAWQIAMKDCLELSALNGYQQDYSSEEFSPWVARHSIDTEPQAVASNSIQPHSNENFFSRVALQNDSVIGNYLKRISPMGNMPVLADIRSKQWMAFQQYELNVVWVASKEVAASMRPGETFEVSAEQPR